MSRIDYILVRGWGESPVRRCQVDDFLVLSRHQLIWADIGAADVALRVDQQAKLQIPNMRRANSDQKLSMAISLGSAVENHQVWIDCMANGPEPNVDWLADGLISMANSACKSNIPYTGGRNLWSKLSASLAQKRERYSHIRSLAKKVHSGDGFFSDRKWQSLINCKLASSCHSWGDPAADWNKWLSSADNAIREIRRLERAEQQRMRALPADSWGQNEIADAHRMLSKGKGELVSVIDPNTNQLAVSASDVKRVLVQHFQTALNNSEEKIEPLDASERDIVDRVYANKPNVDPAWFSYLMNPVSKTELLRSLRSGKYVVAPGGKDVISTGVWRCAAELDKRVLSAITVFTNACLRCRQLPACGKASIIVPILKTPNGERSTDNLRPISLQSGLAKIVTKLLATRLADIFSRHSVLHPAVIFLPV